MSVAMDTRLAQKAAQTLRFLSADAVEAANSGHPGLPMGAADLAFVLWTRFLRFDPRDPQWLDRDRFVLSAGHGSALLYSLLHLSGYDLSLDDLKQFRQWGSKTPGHPEFGHTPGVEATTGPLGHGISNAVGMALSAKMLAERFNGDEFAPVSHRIFVLASDGDLMEGVSSEACSHAGHLGLGNMVVLYDDNKITIEGDTAGTFTEDVGKRYEAYGWHVQHIDGHDHEAIAAAIEAAIVDDQRPSIIVARTHIAYGAPTKQDTADAHGAPLGAEELAASKVAAGWPADSTFHVPEEVRKLFQECAGEGATLRMAWQTKLEAWLDADADRTDLWDQLWNRKPQTGVLDQLLAAAPTDVAATRAHSGKVLQEAARLVPALIGGSADLGPSNKTEIKGSSFLGRDAMDGRNIHFGVREHGMGAIMNGFLYHGAFRPFGGTFLIFSDFIRPAIRLAALSKLPAIYVFTHDSIFLGEDGPTHQAVEQTASLRLIPNLKVYRPADGYETALAWGSAIENTEGPTAIVLTRQSLPPLPRTGSGEMFDARNGGYRVVGEGRPDLVLAATGSEVALALAAQEALQSDELNVHVVSIPCLEVLDQQDPVYRTRLLPRDVPVVTLEAGRTAPWKALAGRDGLTIGIDRFGASAPAKVLAEKYGLTAEQVTEKIRAWLAGGPTD